MLQTTVSKIIESFKDGSLNENMLSNFLKEEKEQLCLMYVQGRNDNHLDDYLIKHASETYDELFINIIKKDNLQQL